METRERPGHVLQGLPLVGVPGWSVAVRSEVSSQIDQIGPWYGEPCEARFQ